MALWASVLIVLVAIVLIGLYKLGALRQRKAREPPLDKGPIPWLGYSKEFSKDASIFLKKMQERHGDIFTVQLCGRYVTFVTDPFTYDAILKESKDKLGFSKLVSEKVIKIFDIQYEEGHQKISSNIHTKHLSASSLVVITQAVMDNLQTLLLEPDGGIRPASQEWKQDGLLEYCYSVIFRAGYLALFGSFPTSGKTGRIQDLLHSQKVFQEFRKFDRLFPRAFYSILHPKEKQEMKRLRHFFWDILSSQQILEKDNVSSWIHSIQQEMIENGVSDKGQSQNNLVLLWASQGSTTGVNFWTLFFLLKNPEALKAVREEAEGILRKMGKEKRPGGVPINFDYNMLKQTPVLDSVMEETLRLVVAPFLARSVMQDMTLKMDDGREYALRKGDEVCVFPYLFLHMDPEIHSDPTTFKYDRFLTLDGSQKVVFYKQGRRIKSHMLPWGAGTTLCPGRFLALNQIKMFIFLMVTQYDMELVDQEAGIPPINVKRWGMGPLQPMYDVQFRYRLRF
ncbi:5-beta-cholestane-3-alpha,7-alpha-diol 12-alpha-hydroxylase-like [Monodelphis domestica]|uniref:5-beta-cholestane-3-alpha,7-alpha-diol 12-alpha-hydroxylase-like n=1 Tax=Monodelphis domestica TaxID=13616 RepID=UPI0024E1FA25|nr:5-beta-cholestane-3-alpha,7-alpha-diol 12-alpha-hydroxylase-like [Monodelphis domestica]